MLIVIALKSLFKKKNKPGKHVENKQLILIFAYLEMSRQLTRRLKWSGIS